MNQTNPTRKMYAFSEGILRAALTGTLTKT